MKKTIILLSALILTLLFLSSCVNVTVDEDENVGSDDNMIEDAEVVDEDTEDAEVVEEDTEDTEVVDEDTEEVDEDTEDAEEVDEDETESTDGYYDLYEGSTYDIMDNSIEIEDISTAPRVDIIINGEDYNFQATKEDELIDGMRISIDRFNIDHGSSGGDYVTTKIETLELEDNQYIIYKDRRQEIGEKEIVLKESKSTGFIQVFVYEKDTIEGDGDSIKSGDTETINSLEITNLENYYKNNLYALIEATEV